MVTPTPINELNLRASTASIRVGYSLLELMIALALLSGLLAAGWSMLATYRDAEQRGWRLVQRTQVVRVAHSWLQNDLMHIAVPDTSVQSQPISTSKTAIQKTNSAAGNRSVAQSQESQLLVGTSRGFTATITPSFDPVPFFQRMLAGQQGAEDGVGVGDLQPPNSSQSTGDDLLAAPVEKPLWPLKNLQVEYQLVQSSEALVGAEVVPVYDLVRRESVGRAQLPQSQQDPLQSTERALTIDDLYRQSDVTAQADQALLQENQLPGLTNAEFWYCDGAQWKRSWNSSSGPNDRDNRSTKGQLPTAVALVFDFAPRAIQTPARPTTTDFSISPADKLDRLNSFDLGMPSVEEPMLESSTDSFELIERDVRLVVLLEQRSQAATPSNQGISLSPTTSARAKP